jgi:hypothetical protein
MVEAAELGASSWPGPMRLPLFSPAKRIRGGSNAIRHNVIAKHLPGLSPPASLLPVDQR